MSANDRIRERLARRFRTRDAGAFSLLEAIGRDCVGAVQLLPDGKAPTAWDRIDAEPLTDDEIGQLLAAVPSERTLGLGADDDDLLRISLAGAQEKTALTRVGDRWCRPHGATPTTHIFKLPLGMAGGSRRVDLRDSVENEWLCSQILRELGLPIANAEMAEFAGRKVLIVERFDREWMPDGPWIARLPQEDFCQALGCPPTRKYEKDGGPGMADCLKLLAGSADADADRLTFLLTQFAFWLLAATDGHAKNCSIFLGRGDAYTMAPLYDVLSAWPTIGDAPNQFRWKTAGLAMAVRSKNAHYALHAIQPRHWEAVGPEARRRPRLAGHVRSGPQGRGDAGCFAQKAARRIPDQDIRRSGERHACSSAARLAVSDHVNPHQAGFRSRGQTADCRLIHPRFVYKLLYRW